MFCLGALSACTPPPILDDERPRRALIAPQRDPLQLRFASTALSSAVARRLLYVATEGSAPTISLVREIDRVDLALSDGLIDGGFQMSVLPPTSHSIKVASSSIWWASRSGRAPLTAQALSALLTEPHSRWPNGDLFQLCLRPLSDPLAHAWRDHNTHLDSALSVALNQALVSQRWPRFVNEAELLEHLERTPGAIALMEEGRLRLFGAKLKRVMIVGAHSTEIRTWFTASLTPTYSMTPWLSFLKSNTRAEWVEEWGWDP